jgi:hypothetical protein
MKERMVQFEAQGALRTRREDSKLATVTRRLENTEVRRQVTLTRQHVSKA